MGFSNRSNSNKRFVQIVQGRLTIKVQPGTEGAVKRTNKQGKVVHELQYDRLEGYLVEFSHRQSKFGLEFLINLEDDQGQEFQVAVPYDSRYTQEFLNCLPNVRHKEPLTLSCYSFTPEDKPDKTIRGWTIWQGKERVQGALAVERMPELKKVTVRGQTLYDATDRINHLWNIAVDWAEKVGLFGAPVEDRTPIDPSTEPPFDPTDDLPEDFR